MSLPMRVAVGHQAMFLIFLRHVDRYDKDRQATDRGPTRAPVYYISAWRAWQYSHYYECVTVPRDPVSEKTARRSSWPHSGYLEKRDHGWGARKAIRQNTAGAQGGTRAGAQTACHMGTGRDEPADKLGFLPSRKLCYNRSVKMMIRQTSSEERCQPKKNGGIFPVETAWRRRSEVLG